MGCLCHEIAIAKRDLTLLALGGTRTGSALTQIGETAQRLQSIAGHLTAGAFAENIGTIAAEVESLHAPLGRATGDVQVQQSGAQRAVSSLLSRMQADDEAHHAAMAEVCTLW